MEKEWYCKIVSMVINAISSFESGKKRPRIGNEKKNGNVTQTHTVDRQLNGLTKVYMTKVRMHIWPLRNDIYRVYSHEKHVAHFNK